MRRLDRLAVVGLIAILAACTGSAMTAAPTPTAPASPPSASAIPAPESPSPEQSIEPSVEPVPSDDLGAFSCDFSIVEDATVAPPANIVDVRVGTHDGYDRVVFEFLQGLPEFSLDRATPPFRHDATGEPVEVEGTSFLRLTMRGGTKETVDHTSSYDGPIEFHPGFETLVDLVEGGDFEAQSTWYFGLAAESCVRVFTLTDAGTARLVIDIEH